MSAITSGQNRGAQSYSVAVDSNSRRGKTGRVTVRLTGTLGDQIRELEELTAASSPSEVVRRALIVYHTLVKQKIAGNEPQIEIKGGDKKKVIPIFL